MLSDACEEENLKKAKDVSKKLFKEKCIRKEYGYIILSEDGYIETNIKKKKGYDHPEESSSAESSTSSESGSESEE